MAVYDVLVYGPIFCDVIFTGLPSMPNLGEEIYADQLTISLGGSAIIAAGLQKLGLQVGLIADLGNDPFSKILCEMLGEYRLDRTLIRKRTSSLKQVTVALSYPSDRAFVTRFEHPEKPINLHDVFRKHSTQHLHVCSFLAGLDNPQAGKVAHAAGATISADFGWDKKALHGSDLVHLVKELDVFLPSKSEICEMMQEADIDSAASKAMSLMEHGDLYVKDGRHGVFGFVRGSPNRIHVPAIDVSAVDTTGAGDAFDAGFIYAYVNQLPPRSCMAYGAACGGLTTTVPGGTEGFPDLKELKKWL